MPSFVPSSVGSSAPSPRRVRIAKRLLSTFVGLAYALAVIGLLEGPTPTSARTTDASSTAVVAEADEAYRSGGRKGRATRTPTPDREDPTATPYSGPSPTPTPTVYPLGPLAEVFGLRHEDRIGCRENKWTYGSQSLSDCLDKFGLDQMAKLEANTPWKTIPSARTKFVVPDLPPDPNEDGFVDVAITFSAMILTELQLHDAPVLVRALIDGQAADPGHIVIADGSIEQQFHVRSFVFGDQVTPGIHTVEIQWASPNTAVHVRDASVEVILDLPERNLHDLAIRTSEPFVTHTVDQAVWNDIPDTLQAFEMPENGEVAFTFAATFEMLQGDFFQVRPVIDGLANAEPPSIAMGARTFHREARSATFTIDGLAPGWHQVKWQWRSSLAADLAITHVYAYSSRVLAGPKQTDSTSLDVSVQPGQTMALKGDGWVPIDGLEDEVALPGTSELSVTFSGDVTGWNMSEVAPILDGVVQEDLAVVAHYPANFCLGAVCGSDNITDAGARSFTFSFKNLPYDEDGVVVGMAVRPAEIGDEAWVIVHDATMTVLRQPYVGVDLAEGANMGAGSKKYEAIIEPARGVRPVLAIVMEPEREDHPEADGDFMTDIDELVFGNSPSAATYYPAVSGGRLSIDRAGLGVLGPYGLSEDAEHYWARHSCPGDEEEQEGDIQEGYRSGYAKMVAEALEQADGDFDFSTYDTNRDGVINADELAIVVVTPQDGPGGSNAVSNFKPHCESPKGFYSEDLPGGLQLRQLVHWYTPGKGDEPETWYESANVLNHELGHLLVWNDDAYGAVPVWASGPQQGQVCDPDGPDAGDPECQNRVIPTAPDVISLMSRSGDDGPHPDGFHKLHMGWVTPETIGASGTYTLADVKTEGRVMILPRFDAPHLEYFLLETRFENDNPHNDLYDFGINDDGLAIYHVIEPTVACTENPDACASTSAPMCIPQTVWEEHFGNFLRTGLRLIQPDGGHRRLCWDDDGETVCGLEQSETLWGSMGAGQSIWQDGLDLCPPVIGDELPEDATPQLRWSDGSPSGYKILDIRFAPGSKMTFDLVSPLDP